MYLRPSVLVWLSSDLTSQFFLLALIYVELGILPHILDVKLVKNAF